MATPKLALIPTGYKAGKLYSVLPESGVGDFTVVRATEATRVNEEGLIETMGANVPRLDYSGGGCPVLLTEGQSTNLLPYSEDFSQNNWVKVNNAIVSATKVISPDGTLNASQIIFDGTSQGRIEDAIPSLIQGVDYTVSVYARVSSGTQIVNFGSVNDFSYTLTTEWQRLTSTEVENDTVGYPRLICNDAATIEIYGFQLEQGSYPTSYIKTEGSVVTRNGDQVYGAGDAATFNDSEGVLMAEIEIPNKSTTDSYPIAIFGTGATLQIYYRASSQSISFLSSVGGIQYLFHSTINPLGNHKLSLVYKQGQYSAFIDGFLMNRQNSGNVPSNGTLNTLSIKDSGSSNFYGRVKQIQYFNTVLTDSELETLTSWTSFIEMAQAQNYNII